MKRGRPRKIKPEEGQEIPKKHKLKKEEDSDYDTDFKPRIPKKLKKHNDDIKISKKGKKEKKFEIPQIDINEVFLKNW